MTSDEEGGCCLLVLIAVVAPGLLIAAFLVHRYILH